MQKNVGKLMSLPLLHLLNLLQRNPCQHMLELCKVDSMFWNVFADEFTRVAERFDVPNLGSCILITIRFFMSVTLFFAAHDLSLHPLLTFRASSRKFLLVLCDCFRVGHWFVVYLIVKIIHFCKTNVINGQFVGPLIPASLGFSDEFFDPGADAADFNASIINPSPDAMTFPHMVTYEKIESFVACGTIGLQGFPARD